MALARVKGSVAVCCGHVAPHGGWGIGVRLAMPEVDGHADVFAAEIPRAGHEGCI